ncbi:MAG: hypothetical protein ACI96M_003870 [Candidatus Azotimanducaceae bacterium]
MLGLIAVADYAPLLKFWFGALEDGIASEKKRANWFASDPGYDAECQQFAPLLSDAASGRLNQWNNEPRGRLALVLLCDQIPRNVFRGTSQAYQFDNLALKTAKEGILQGSDLALHWDERAFFYMPFEHSERLLDQHTAVGLFSKLRDDVPNNLNNMFGNTLRFAHKHRDIIIRFGRFPHRNEVLTRTSTAEEIEFLTAADHFGQSQWRNPDSRR